MKNRTFGICSDDRAEFVPVPPQPPCQHITYYFLACNALFSDSLINLNGLLLHSQKKTNSIHKLNIDLYCFTFTLSGLAVLARLLEQFKMEWKDLRIETNNSLESQKGLTSRQEYCWFLPFTINKTLLLFWLLFFYVWQLLCGLSPFALNIRF